MWTKDRQDGAAREQGEGSDIIAFVGRGVEFKGVISYEGTVRIDGRVEGEIRTGGVLHVGDEAVINAKITAGSVIIKGRVVGDITAAEKVRLLAPASFRGSVQTPVFSIEEGVTFDGTCEMTAKEPAQVHELQREAALRPTGTGAMKRIGG
jgi:cytoskeletal protein CcmA (bactofilin family)